MKGIIKSYSALTIAIIASFFVFALSGLFSAAVSLGLLSILMISIKQWVVQPSVNERQHPFYSPTRSRRLKNKRMRVA